MAQAIHYGHRAWHRGPGWAARRWATVHSRGIRRSIAARRIAEASAMARGARAQVREVSS